MILAKGRWERNHRRLASLSRLPLPVKPVYVSGNPHFPAARFFGVNRYDFLHFVVRARPGRPRQRRRTASVRLERTRFHGPEAAVIHRVNLPFGEGIDPTRSVVVNDGWEHTVLNIITLHDYEEDGEQFLARYVRREEILGNRMPFNNDRYALARGYEYRASRSSSASTAASRSRRTPAGATATTFGTKRSSSSAIARSRPRSMRRRTSTAIATRR